MRDFSFQLQHVSRSFRMGSMLFGKKIMAVDDVNLTMPGDKPWILSIVGESGSGKTTLARMILGLLEPSAGNIIISGSSIVAHGGKRDLSQVQPIFQNPFSAFSARRTVDCYLFETARNVCHCNSRSAALKLMEETLQSVGIEVQSVLNKYPNQFSGGELQRISIARALMVRPKLIIADEPVAMIDASLRMNVVNMFRSLRDKYGLCFVYVTHDLSTAYYVSDYVATMYRGQVIESGAAKALLEAPAHPYTRLLLDSVPMVGRRWEMDVSMPDMEGREYLATGCRFAARCPKAHDACFSQCPSMACLPDGREVLCHLKGDLS